MQVDEAHDAPPARSDLLARLVEAEDTLRAIGAGEVDAFVVSDGPSRRVFSLSTADRPYRTFVENMRDGAATLSPDGLVLYANRRLIELLGRPREQIVGAQLATFVAGGATLELAEIQAGPGATFECELLAAGGAGVPVQVGVTTLLVDDDRMTCLTFTDLSAHKAKDCEIARLGRVQADRMAQLERAQAALTEQATHDALTGLPNRALVVDRIEQALSHAQRSGRCTAVFFVDLDRFKQVNDTRGHAAGDTVLRNAAATLLAAVRPMDTVARIGGDEFAVLAPDVDSRLHAVELGARLVGEMCRRGDGDTGERMAASIGVSVSLGGRGTAEALLDEADRAMYQAKSRGGGRAEVFDVALGRQLRERSTARRLLQAALDEERIAVHYQPIVDLVSGTVAGFEALARIAQRNGSYLPPAAFIPVAEDSGLVLPLGESVLGMACHEAGGWHPAPHAGGRPLSVAVNLSSRQFEPGDLAKIVRERLELTGLAPQRLHLELTETAVMDLHPRVLQQLGRIRELGVEIGLDDFGTGYASLTHLRRLPLSFVKIDRSFVQGLGTEQGDDRIVSAVVDLAANLGLRSVAEGVETDEQLHRLRELGCDQAQGYLFARPLVPQAVAEVILHPAW
jgi:diguanylate cyclase (GGDEF)-like protein